MSSAEITALENRATLLENVVNNVQIALRNVASQEAVRQIILLVQRDIQDLQTDIDDLKARVALIEQEVFR